MIRVLQVFGRMDRGGAEAMIMDIYRQIDRTKIQFDFVVHTNDHCSYDDEIRDLGGRIFSVPRFSLKSALIYKKSWRDLFLKHNEWSIVHGHVRSTASIYLSIAKEFGMYTIAHSHNTSSGTGFAAFVKDKLQRKIQADYYLACSQSAGEWLFGSHVIQDNYFSVLPNAINTSSFRYDEHKRKKIRSELKTDGLVVGHVGNFKAQKNHKFVLEVFKSFLAINPEAQLVLVGSGQLENDIKVLSCKLGIDNKVHFLGNRTDISDLMQAMDLFLFPSFFEGLGVVLIEAQAVGLPCLISDNIPNEVVLTNLISVMSLSESSDSWALRLNDMINYERRGYQEELISSGYDIKSTSKWIEEFYDEHSKKK